MEDPNAWKQFGPKLICAIAVPEWLGHLVGKGSWGTTGAGVRVGRPLGVLAHRFFVDPGSKINIETHCALGDVTL